MSSCSNTRYLHSSESLLVSNKVVLKDLDEKRDRRNLKDDLVTIPIQKPNKKALGMFRLKLALYNASLQRKKPNNKFNKWIREKVGEEAVVFDTTKFNQTQEMFDNYLFNMGYFTGKVNAKYETRKQRTVATYVITVDDPFELNKITFPDGNTPVERITLNDAHESLLKRFEPFDIATLKEERERITTDLRNSGYFTFSRDNVFFEIDTQYNYRTVDVKVKIAKSDSTKFNLYHINNIYVFSNYSLADLNKLVHSDTGMFENKYFISDVNNFKKRRLNEFLYIKKGELYNQDNHKLTINRLVNTGVFKFVNIQFVPELINGIHFLNCYVYLTPSRRQGYSVDLETNYSTNGFLGNALQFTYSNKNLTKAADKLNISLSGGISLDVITKDTLASNSNSIFNSTEFNADISYYQNRFIFPFRLKKQSRVLDPKTKISLGYTFKRRISFYTLHSTYVTFGYQWSKNNRLSQQIDPVQIQLLLFTNKEQAFIDRLNERKSLRASYSEQFIPATDYRLSYLGQKSDDDSRFVNFYLTTEVAGNLAYGILKAAKAPTNAEGSYTIYNVPISQYFRIETDTRYYFMNPDKSGLVLRTHIGLGVPYGNVNYLPYVKQFYNGGPNSMRAFTWKSLGPGAYKDTTDNQFKDQSGDIKLELNLEYRFNIFKWFKGAIFSDAGNIWLLRDDSQQPDGVFRLNSFYKQIAVGAGVGIRADFSYFVLRMDVGIPLVDPREDSGKRWLVPRYSLKQDLGPNQIKPKPVINFAIGYPF